ncbi:hypothetical protein EDD16DRAFT_288155 [Pisolithus croceorrhizus]|nr:hypothetical protein EDD16DRAFT_288155 [Pisolithus croceorrhizus]
MLQTQRVSLGLSQPHLSVHPDIPSAQPLCAPLSAERPSRCSVPVQPEVPIRTPSASSSSSDASLCRPHSPPRVLPTGHSRGRPPSRSRARSRDLDDPRSYSYSSRPRSRTRSRDLDDPHLYSYSSGPRSRDSRDSCDHWHGCSPPPVPRLAYSRLPEISRDEPTPVQPVDMFLASRISSIRSSRSSHASAHSRRSRSRSRTPQPSCRLY